MIEDNLSNTQLYSQTRRICGHITGEWGEAGIRVDVGRPLEGVIRENIPECSMKVDAYHLRGQPMAMARMVQHVDEMGGGSCLCPPWGLFGQNAQNAQNAYCAWMQHRFEGATPAQQTFLLL